MATDFNLGSYKELGWSNEKYPNDNVHSAVRGIEKVFLDYEKRIKNLTDHYEQELTKERNLREVKTGEKVPLTLFLPFKTELDKITIDDTNFYDKIAAIKAQAEETKKLQDDKLIKNKEVIETLVDLMQKTGLSKDVKRPKTNRVNSPMISVEAEWYRDLKQILPLNCTPQYSLQFLQFHDSIVRRRKEWEEKRKQESIQEKSKEDELKAFKKESILIAAACIKFNADPKTISTIKELDDFLQSIGEVPYTVRQKIESELGL